MMLHAGAELAILNLTYYFTLCRVVPEILSTERCGDANGVGMN